jgi:hypothetical protein
VLRLGKRAAVLAAFALVASSLVPACSLGQGDGSIAGTLNVPNCWTGHYSLSPDFFAAVPSNNSLQIRIQHGSDFETFADGVAILVDDITKIRPNPGASFAGLYGQPLAVALPVGVTPPGVPIVANPNPANVNMALYLQESCHTDDVTLYAMPQVTIDASSPCDADPLDNGDPATGCTSTGSGNTGKSTISFTSLFDGNDDESNAAQRLSRGCFDIYLADPRNVAPGGQGPPPACEGHLRGSFSFYYQRGRPAQPFP